MIRDLLRLGLVVMAGTVALAAPNNRAPDVVTSQAPGYCGKERRAVKQLLDRPVLLPARPSTVSALGEEPEPILGFATPRLAGERRVAVVDVLLDAAKAEEDSDVHIGVRDPAEPSRSMIVEAVDPGCASGASAYRRGQMRRVRAALVSACGPIPSTAFRHLRGRARLKGVVFFDRPHGQYDRAPNAVELHPVLRLDIESCR